MNLCYYHFVHDNCRFGERCKWSHETPTPPYTDHFMCSGLDARKPVDSSDLEYIDPYLIEDRKRRIHEMEIEHEIRMAIQEAEENIRRRREERRKQDRLEWDFPHPNKIIVAVTTLDEIFRYRAPMIQLTEPLDYVLFQAMRFRDDFFYNGSVNLAVYDIEIRNGDTTNVGFIKLDRIAQALCLYSKLPLELIEIIYRFNVGKLVRRPIKQWYTYDSGYGSY